MRLYAFLRAVNLYILYTAGHLYGTIFVAVRRSNSVTCLQRNVAVSLDD